MIETIKSGKRVAFVSSRISGTDGVSMEIAKWAEVREIIEDSNRRERMVAHNYAVAASFSPTAGWSCRRS